MLFVRLLDLSFVLLLQLYPIFHKDQTKVVLNILSPLQLMSYTLEACTIF